MGNLLLSTGLFKTDAPTSQQTSSKKFVSTKITHSVTYYYTPFSGAVDQTALPVQSPQAPCPLSSLSPSDLPLSDSSSAVASSCPQPSHSPSLIPVSSRKQPYSASTIRPLLVFFSWLGARPAAVAKYRDLYLDRGMDVLLVQSSVMHFLWPRWGLDYGLEILNILEEPQFSQRVVLVHASSIGGYTFTQLLTHIAQGPNEHSGLEQRISGQIYDSLVVGSLEHMAVGLGKTLMPRLEGFIRSTAMLYFWLFKSHTANLYETSIQVFHNNPVTAPALFFFSENDVMCNCSVLEKLIDLWRKRGVSVESMKWKESIHAGHMRCHPEDYLSTLQHFLNSLSISTIKSKVVET